MKALLLKVRKKKHTIFYFSKYMYFSRYLCLTNRCIVCLFFFIHQDLYSGLLGPLVVCRPGTLRLGEGPDRQRDDVEAEFALLFMVHDENQSWYKEENIRTYLGMEPDSVTEDEDFVESNMMHGKSKPQNFLC